MLTDYEAFNGIQVSPTLPYFKWYLALHWQSFNFFFFNKVYLVWTDTCSKPAMNPLFWILSRNSKKPFIQHELTKDTLLNRIEHEHICCYTKLVVFRFYRLISTIYDSKKIVQFKYQMKFLWDDKNLPHYHK